MRRQSVKQKRRKEPRNKGNERMGTDRKKGGEFRQERDTKDPKSVRQTQHIPNENKTRLLTHEKRV